MTPTREQIIATVIEAGFTEHTPREHINRFTKLFTLIEQAVRADEQNRCCRIVTGLCISDNNAQEITDAIRKENK